MAADGGKSEKVDYNAPLTPAKLLMLDTVHVGCHQGICHSQEERILCKCNEAFIRGEDYLEFCK